MLFFYLFALVPAIIGAILWVTKREIVLAEWMASVVVALLISGFFHLVALEGMTGDTETWSGEIVQTTFYPKWIEEYQVAIYKTVTHTDSKGNSYTTEEFSHYETRHRTHDQYWTVDCTVNGEVNVDKGVYDLVGEKFGGKIITTTPYKSGFDSGDKNVYHYENVTGYIFPTTASRSFENRVKAAPSVFSFIKVPEDVKVFSYPKNRDMMNSDRLLGSAKKHINLLEFDRLNSNLGARKKVNIIIVGFPAGTPSINGDYQQSAWFGGKKNDLVICYAGDNKAEWVKVFGWTEKEIVKRNLESIVLSNEISDNLLPLIRDEVTRNYEIKDWSKFDYISIEVPMRYKIVFVIVMIFVQIICSLYFLNNDFEKSVLNSFPWKGRRI